eukprot:206675_1
MPLDTSRYSQITEPQERLIIGDIMIISSIGFTISFMILYSLIHVYRSLNGYRDIRYYAPAVRYCIVSSIGSMMYFVLKICSNDLVVPIHAFITNNTRFISIVDSLLVGSVCASKISAYLGFALVYLATFRKPRMDAILKILLVFVCGANLGYFIAYLYNDISVFSMTEIGVTPKRHVYVPYPAYTSQWIQFIGLVSIIFDFLFLSTLLSCYMVAGRCSTNDYHQKANGVRGVVLVCCSIIVLAMVTAVNMLDNNVKYLVQFDSCPVLADLICLYLMFKNNEEIYEHLCGCVCGKCCSNLWFGSYYKVVIVNYEEGSEDQNGDNVPRIPYGDDRLPFNDDPSFML